MKTKPSDRVFHFRKGTEVKITDFEKHPKAYYKFQYFNHYDPNCDVLGFVHFKSQKEKDKYIEALKKVKAKENILTCNHAFIVASHSVDDIHTHFVARCKHCGKENTRVFWS